MHAFIVFIHILTYIIQITDHNSGVFEGGRWGQSPPPRIFRPGKCLYNLWV